MLIDPVCGKRVNRNKAHIVVEYESVAYALCCPLCQATFEREPKSYARAELGEKIHRRADGPRSARR